jgi:predicted nucleic acid-binding protein
MTARPFVDTNVLVYAYDSDQAAKQIRALAELDRARSAGPLILSTQVLQEFYTTVTRKLARPVPEADARSAVAELATQHVVQVDPALILAAIDLGQNEQLSFWDALIVQAALTAGCTTLLSEDLQHNRRYGRLTVVNPFHG